MKNSKVSIIVAIYKSEKFLNKLIDSILNQTYKNIEVILVDDGSPDNSGKICDEYAKIDSRIIVIHQKNAGACEARNSGLKVASGKYISIIDGDDWLENDYIEYLVNMITTTNTDMAMTDKIFTTRDRIQINNDNISVISPEEAFCEIIYPIIPIGPWNKLFKKDIIDKNNLTFSVPWSGEGLYFTSYYAQLCKNVSLGHKKIYNYRLNNTNSGLTKYNVQMGLNALWNIKNIKQKLIIKNKRTINACNWHIWKNHNFLLKLIIATDSCNIYKKEYEECIKMIHQDMFKVFWNSELGIKSKIKILFVSIFPTFFAKRSIIKEQKLLKRDIKNIIEN